MPENNQKGNHYRNQIQDERLSKVERHIEIINDELSSIKVSVAKIEVSQKLNLAVMTLILGAIVALFLK